jgi:V/A-type H+-transporting ATPase subunit D
MELMRLKKRIALAKRGHKLLKDKRDELMRRFMILIEDYRDIRGKMEHALETAFGGFLLARAMMSRSNLEGAILSSPDKVRITPSTERIMNIKTVKFDLEQDKDIYSYGFADTSADLDKSLKLFSDTLPLMILLAEKEKAIKLLADEIEKTRRRVNALEYVLIPSLKENIRGITMRLGEIERSALTRLMKVKDIVRKH